MKSETPPPLHRLGSDRPWSRSPLWRRLAAAQDAVVARDALPAPAARERGRPRPRPWGRALLAMGAAAAAIAALAQVRLAHLPFGRGGSPDGVGQVLVADARSDLPLRFSDGSTLTFGAGSTGRLQRLSDDGADVFLESGRLEAHVVHADATLWLVHAGPYRVRVTGTRFAVSWSAARLDVDLFEGSVMIDGAVLGAGVPLRAGQRLTVDRGVVRTDLLAFVRGPAGPAAARPTPAPPAEEPLDTAAIPAVAKDRADDHGDWLAFARQGAYAEAFSAAERAGWTRLCHRLDARRLLMLGDVARYADAGGRAEEAFEALVRRFPHDQLAADAVFSLGRLAFESDQSDRAARWFRRYVQGWPHGALADQAVGRLMECAVHMHDGEAARSAARLYLARAAGGPHADLARRILRDEPEPAATVSP